MSNLTSKLESKERDEYIASHFPQSNVATKSERLKGDELLNYIKGNESASKTELCLRSGYVKESGKPAFTDWYESILQARGVGKPSEMSEDTVADHDWYNKLSESDQELYDKIEDICPEFQKLDAEMCQEFINELKDYGINDADTFEDAYYYQISYAHDESQYGEFVEYLVTELDCCDLPDYLVIDWQQSWYSNYRHDFIDIEFDGEVYFFTRHF